MEGEKSVGKQTPTITRYIQLKHRQLTSPIRYVTPLSRLACDGRLTGTRVQRCNMPANCKGNCLVTIDGLDSRVQRCNMPANCTGNWLVTVDGFDSRVQRCNMPAKLHRSLACEGRIIPAPEYNGVKCRQNCIGNWLVKAELSRRQSTTV